MSKLGSWRSRRRGGFLSPREGEGSVQRLAWRGEGVRARVEAAVSSVVEEWLSAWGLEDRAPGARVEVLEAVPRLAWSALDAIDGMWWGLEGGATAQRDPQALVERDLFQAIFGEDATGPSTGPLLPRVDASAAGEVAAEVAGHAWRDLHARLAAGTGAPPSVGDVVDRSATRLWARDWSGALAVRVAWWSTAVVILVSGQIVERFARADEARPRPRVRDREPLVPAWRAAADRKVRVEAALRGFDVALGALATMAVGDILRTPHPLEDPVVIALCGVGERTREAVCAGLVGSTGGARGVELVSSVARADATPSRDSRSSSENK